MDGIHEDLKAIAKAWPSLRLEVSVLDREYGAEDPRILDVFSLKAGVITHKAVSEAYVYNPSVLARLAREEDIAFERVMSQDPRDGYDVSPEELWEILRRNRWL